VDFYSDVIAWCDQVEEWQESLVPHPMYDKLLFDHLLLIVVFWALLTPLSSSIFLIFIFLINYI